MFCSSTEREEHNTQGAEFRAPRYSRGRRRTQSQKQRKIS